MSPAQDCSILATRTRTVRQQEMLTPLTSGHSPGTPGLFPHWFPQDAYFRIPTLGFSRALCVVVSGMGSDSWRQMYRTLC